MNDYTNSNIYLEKDVNADIPRPPRISYREEQILVIITTVLSIVTANVWSDVIETFFHKYFNGGGITYRLGYAIFMTVATIYLVDYLVTHTDLFDRSPSPTESKKEHLGKYKLSNYVRNIISP